jgi:3-hydroxyisobutyrate dehydrogenase-like beta-hydroxyacid dehydrogenase
MAGHLLANRHDLTIWNRTPSKGDELVSRGAFRADSLESLGIRCEVIFLCVGGSQDVGECLEKLVLHTKPGTLIVDHSTISPKAAKQFHATLTEKGLRFIDAPITGGSMGATNGTLTIFCGGEQATIDSVRPAMSAYGKRIECVGGPGAGQTMKAANQIAVAGALLGLCESLAFAKAAGLNLHQTRDLLSSGAAGSWAFENYGPKILERDYSPGFSIKNQRKDLAYCIEAAAALNMDLPGTQLVDELLEKLSEAGRSEEATAALFDVLSPAMHRA